MAFTSFHLRFLRAWVVVLTTSLTACQAAPAAAPQRSAVPPTTVVPSVIVGPTGTPAPTTTPAATATATPPPLPAAVQLETAPGIDGVADLGLTRVRISRFLRGPEAQLQLPVDELGRAPEGYGWVYLQFTFESACTAADNLFNATGPITNDMYACSLNADFTFEDTAGRAYPALAKLDAHDQVLVTGANPVSLTLDQTRVLGIAAVLPDSAELWRVSLDRFYFDPGLFDPMQGLDYAARRNVIFVLGGQDQPAAMPAPEELNKIGWDSAHPAQVGDMLVTPGWQVRVISIQEGDEAVAAAAALGLVPKRAYRMDYLMTLEMTCQGSSFDDQDLPHFTGIGEDPHQPVGFHDWTPAGQAVYPQSYYPGAHFRLYLTGHPKPGNRPVQIKLSYEDRATSVTVERFLAATSPVEP